MKTAYAASSQIQKAWDLFGLLMRRDLCTGEHSLHVACMAKKMSSYVCGHFGEEKLFISGLLHDIGKIEFPDYLFGDHIVSEEEDYRIIKKHPLYSKKILSGCGFDNDIVRVAYEHHERFNGSGYPSGLKENQISFESRIIAILDSFSAIIKGRPYKEGIKDIDLALSILTEEPGQYDDSLLEIFKNNVVSIIDIKKEEKESLKWI